jgi:hypothetical protein
VRISEDGCGPSARRLPFGFVATVVIVTIASFRDHFGRAPGQLALRLFQIPDLELGRSYIAQNPCALRLKPLEPSHHTGVSRAGCLSRGRLLDLGQDLFVVSQGTLQHGQPGLQCRTQKALEEFLESGLQQVDRLRTDPLQGPPVLRAEGQPDLLLDLRHGLLVAPREVYPHLLSWSRMPDRIASGY